MTKLGDLIRSRRQELRWTQRKLGEMVGVKDSYITRIENGKQKGSYRVLAKISMATRLPWSVMIRTGEIEIPTIDDIDEYMYPALDAAFKSFHPKVKEQLMEIGHILEKYL
jgi:transcriptional regulator with XRE-family HTH domain